MTQRRRTLFSEVSETTSPSELRHFAWGAALVLAVVCWRHAAGPASLALRGAAGAVFALGTLWPGTLQIPRRVFLGVTYPLRFILSYTALALVYYAILTPLALCFRIWGRAGLQCSFDWEAPTYWQARTHCCDPKRYFRQF
jgi:hypothetical protein